MKSLKPSGEIPKREMIVWENEALQELLHLGIAEAERGDLHEKK